MLKGWSIFLGDMNESLWACSIKEIGTKPWDKPYSTKSMHLLLHILPTWAHHQDAVGEMQIFSFGRNIHGCKGTDKKGRE
jgi:hypothetical protein